MIKIIAVCIFLINAVKGEEKSSLAFVIDDTDSMGHDIVAVKRRVDAIFDTVMNSDASQIADFVLVTFNDPDISHRITTRNRYGFKTALSEIFVHDGGDCPEMSMTGIESGLHHSRPGSLLYVFTDASSKDTEIYENVKNLAQKKQIQVVFILTGDCSGEGDDQVYYQLANHTAGEVFNLEKDEVSKILKYVENQINNRKEILAIKHFPPGTHKVDYTVDSTMKELVISVSGRDPRIVVTYPDGGTVPTEDLVRTNRIAIVKVTEVKPGVYSAEVSSPSETSVKVTAETTVHFLHGFSLFKPKTIEETVTRPIPDELSYLSIKLTTDGDGNITLDTVQIIDMDNNVLIEAPLILVNDMDTFYTTDRFELPNSNFRIVIHGRDLSNNKEILRMSLTPVAPQVKEKPSNKSAVVSLVGENRVMAEFKEPFELKCKISGYPKPKAIWMRDSDGKIFESELSLVELPDNYISALKINKVISNNTYTCVGKNDYGEDKKSIEVLVLMRNYFDILQKPEDAVVELGKSKVFECKVNAHPPANIKWYKHNKFEVKSGEGILLAEDNSTMTVVNMLPHHRGIYKCLAENENTEKSFDFMVRISGAEAPEIDKTISELFVREGSHVDIPCKLKKGRKLSSKIQWYVKQKHDLKRTTILGEHFRINNFNTAHIGSYICIADNGMGIDKHTIRLNLAYPPNIFGPEIKNIIAKQGELVIMPCNAEGSPSPDFKWLKDDADLELTSKYTSSYHGKGISFIADKNDSGVYICKATNVYGTAIKTYTVNVIRPVTIEVPEETALALKIGDRRLLQCIADGFPKPNITWYFRHFETTTPPKIIGHETKLPLRRIQTSEQGHYICVASNIGGSVNITYEVKVDAPPMIENVYPEKTFYAVVGDVALRIPCKASGNPRPKIFWIKDGVDKVAAGTEWYDEEEDGTLVIKNVDKFSSGTYVCQAENYLGFDNETYEVIVEPYPRVGSPTKTVLVEQGKSAKLNCGVSHLKTDYVRWYKNGLLISNKSDHHLVNTRVSDSGIYTCRVSNFAKSRSGNIRVNVGVAPWFPYEDKLNIDYEKDVAAVMDCTANGNPNPEVSWWHKGKNMGVYDRTYIIDNMTPKDKGKYFCVVKNRFGQIVREFNILSRECLINMESELTKNQPVILTSRPSYYTRSIKWAAFESEEGNLIVPTDEYLRLQCPSEFENFPKTEIIASCERETNFTVEGSTYKFSQLKCRDEIQPTTERTRKICLPSNPHSETFKIGYASSTFLEVFETCFDVARGTIIYAKHKIHGTTAEFNPKEYAERFKNENLHETYDCYQQNRFTSYILGKPFHAEDGCCFRSRLLVNPMDVASGLPQKATFSNLNIVPQWSSCDSQNWVQVERRVRYLARSTIDDLDVWTGVSQQQLKISDKVISLRDNSPVPKYLWKVVQDPSTKASLAIVQLNMPDITLTDAYRNMPCIDICSEVTWMRSRHWRNVKRGYTFCCRIQDFERAFGYEGIFNGSRKVLYDISFVAERSMTV